MIKNNKIGKPVLDLSCLVTEQNLPDGIRDSMKYVSLQSSSS